MAMIKREIGESLLQTHPIPRFTMLPNLPFGVEVNPIPQGLCG